MPDKKLQHRAIANQKQVRVATDLCQIIQQRRLMLGVQLSTALQTGSRWLSCPPPLHGLHAGDRHAGKLSWVNRLVDPLRRLKPSKTTTG